MKWLSNIIFAIVGAASLTACGGGGGGGGSSASNVTTVGFSSGGYDSIDVNHTASNAVTGYANQSTGSVNVTQKKTGALISYGKFETAAGNKTFDTANGATISTFTRGAFATDSNGDGGIFRLDAYSGYGLWEITQSSSSLRVFAGHAGSPKTTNPASIVSSATYTGYAFGLLTEVGYAPAFTEAAFAASANFSSGVIGVATSGTFATSLSGTNLGSYSSEDFSGSLSKAAGNNYTYSGTVTNGYSGTGTAELMVYGPNADSVAGSVILSKSDNSRKHIVAFGGER